MMIAAMASYITLTVVFISSFQTAQNAWPQVVGATPGAGRDPQQKSLSHRVAG